MCFLFCILIYLLEYYVVTQEPKNKTHKSKQQNMKIESLVSYEAHFLGKFPNLIFILRLFKKEYSIDPSALQQINSFIPVVVKIFRKRENFQLGRVVVRTSNITYIHSINTIMSIYVIRISQAYSKWPENIWTKHQYVNRGYKNICVITFLRLWFHDQTASLMAPKLRVYPIQHPISP